MRQSNSPIKTTKEAPSDEQAPNAKLLIRAGYIHKLMAGVYTQLPLGLKVVENLMGIISDEMEKMGAERILMPALHPKKAWEATGRWEEMDVMYKLEGSSGQEIGLGSTHEEIIAQVVKNHVSSYRDLPFSLYQIQTKFRDEPRATSGLLRGREFTMKDLYSFHSDQQSLDEFYEKAKEAYYRIYERAGLGDKTFITFSDGGSFSKYSYEFQTLAEEGEDTIFLCDECEVGINSEIIEKQSNCPECGNEDLRKETAIEVGDIYKLGTKFSKPVDLTFKTDQGEEKPVIMASYGIGVERLMGSIVEVYHDEDGIIWPEEVAPFDIHLLEIGEKTKELDKESEEVYEQLQEAGLQVLFDDRSKSPGKKFADADLLGMPYRMVVSQNTLEKDKVEIKRRDGEEEKLLDLEQAVNLIKE